MKWYKVVVLQSYICIASVSAAIVSPSLPYIQHDFGLSAGMVQWLVSVFLIGYVIGQLIYAPFANAKGRLVALRFGLVINIIGIIICLLAARVDNYLLILIGRLITSLGAAAGLVCSFVLINELLSPVEAKRAMSFAMVYFTVGIAIAIVAAGFITQYFDWWYCFYLLLAQGVVMFASTWLFEEPLKQSVKINILVIVKNYVFTIKNKTLVGYAFIVGLNSAYTYCYAVMGPLYAHHELHLTSGQYGIWNIINMVGMLMSGLVSNQLQKYLSPRAIVMLALLFLVPGVAALALFDHFAHPSVFCFFFVTSYLFLFNGVLFPSAAYIASNATQDKASASSMMSFIYMGSAMLSVMAMGLLAQSILVSLILVFSIYLISCLIFIICTRQVPAKHAH